MRMLFFLATFCSLGYVVGQECEADEQSENMVNYFNQLTNLYSKLSTVVKTRKFDYVAEYYKNITKVFDEAGCGDMWAKDFTKEQRDQLTLAGFLAEYKPVNIKPVPAAMLGMLKETESFLWLMMKDHVFASCAATLSRNVMFEWITSKCGKDMFPFTKEGLKDFFIPQMYDDKEFESNLRAVTNLLAIAHLRAVDCKEAHEERHKLIGNLVQKTDEDSCYAATDTIGSDACLKDFEGKCPNFNKCFDDYLLGYQEDAPDAFQGQASFMTRCIENSKNHWGKDRPAEVPKHSKILAAGLRMFRKLTAVKLDEEVAPYMSAMMRGIMRPDSCSCNIDQLSVE